MNLKMTRGGVLICFFALMASALTLTALAFSEPKEVKTINTSYTDAPTYEKIKVAITLRDGLDPDYVPVNYSGEKIDDNNVYIVTTADRYWLTRHLSEDENVENYKIIQIN